MHTLNFFPSGKETWFRAKPIWVKLNRHRRAWANKVIWYETIASISTVFPWVVIKRYLQVVVDASTIHMWLNVNVFNSEFNLCIIAAGLKLPCLQIFQYKISLKRYIIHNRREVVLCKQDRKVLVGPLIAFHKSDLHIHTCPLIEFH